MAKEAFYAPADLGEACSLLSELGDTARIIAGGTDLMARFNRRRRLRNEVLVSVGRLGLDFIREEDGRIVIGACAVLADIVASPAVRDHLPLLARACSEMASPAVRNAATLGGNLGTNARNADGVAALMALEAEVVTASTAGEHRMPVESFAAAPRKEKLAGGAIVTQFEVPVLTAGHRWAWEKLKQRQGESRSILSASAKAAVDGKSCTSVRLVLGGMAAHPFVSRTAFALLEGRALSRDLVERTAEEVLAETDPATDARASAWYRKRAAGVLIRRVLGQVAGWET